VTGTGPLVYSERVPPTGPWKGAGLRERRDSIIEGTLCPRGKKKSRVGRAGERRRTKVPSLRREVIGSGPFFRGAKVGKKKNPSPNPEEKMKKKRPEN